MRGALARDFFQEELLEMIFLLDRPFSEQQLSGIAELDLRNIDSKVWPVLLANSSSRKLRLYHLTLPSLEGIEALVDARELELEWATKIETVEPLFQLGNLQRLSIFDFPKLRELNGIESLQNLTELNLSGSRGALSSPLRLVSIKPISHLPNLTSFSLTNAKIEDDDITVLALCSSLRYLKLSNQFERSQVAFLASRLNSQLAEPLTAYVDLRLSCKKCNGQMSMFIGRRMPTLCRYCESTKFEKLTNDFAQLVLTEARH
ncbi:hypothetical protein J2X66_001333 [Pseudomonas sp. 3296]|jgi:hypothetical protein|uniref:leucine-rich repeat domain-containing protein n=1 Tax=Pseudomonas sp. 3296 TaxID=2817753 RepID=UPI0028663446|nr:leucine-rich repeat domain-containing protein [Pseudomonas sp. 3296]MDR6914469.1 hypothetical protein [Pseudomonas sp. 3296]